jgi:hypothetical protein
MRLALIAAALPLVGCAAYGREIVLYDSRTKPAAPAAPEATPAAPDFGRILLLEQTQAELQRAILAGLDTDGALLQKSRDVESEINRRIAAAGEAQVASWRRARIAQLREFKTEK